MNRNRRKGFMALSLAAVMAVGSTAVALADEPGVVPGEAYTEAMARLQDSHMEYDELTDLIKNYYAPIKSAYATIDTMQEDQGSIATAMRVVADDYMSQADQLADALGSGNPAVMQVVGGARTLRSNAGSMDRSIERSKSSRSVDRQVNMIVSGAETLMNQYEYYLAQRTVAAKALEIAQTAQAIQQTMQAQGLAVDADVLSAAAQLSSAKSQLESIDAGIDQIYKSLCYYTGWDKGADTVIGPVPAADPSVIGTLNLAADKETAVNNNYNLISMRSGSGAGMSDFQIRTTKGMTQKANKMRTVDYSEDQLRSDMQTLYDTVLEKKAAYDSASTAYQSAQLTWNAAQIQRQNGTLSQIQFMQQELAYLQAQSGFKCADLNLQQALRNYQWAVKGVSVSAG
ncbi:MAG: TolC family protein [Clostridia bacterium]|nr:TolC family protein [Clostridia bacterium]